MPLYTPEFKQHVLTHYQPGVAGCGFHTLAVRFAVPGGASTVRGWHNRWDGTVLSLHRKPGSGRKPILTPLQIQRHIVEPIRRSNRQHKAVHYQPIRARLIAATGKKPSERTIRRIGHDAAIKHQRTKKRTADERQKHAHRAQNRLYN